MCFYLHGYGAQGQMVNRAQIKLVWVVQENINRKRLLVS